MATRTWQGGTGGSTTDYSVAGNWVEGAVPIAGDAVTIRPNPDGTVYNITAGLNQAGVAVTSFVIDASYDGDIGASGGYLLLNVTTDVAINGNGDMFIDCSAANLLELSVRMDLSTAGHLYWKGPTVTGAYLHRGAMTHVSGTISTCYVSLVDAETQSSDMNLTWTAGTATAMVILGGTTEMNGGTWTDTTQTNGEVTIVNGSAASIIQRGGTLDYRSATTLTLLQVYGLTADFTCGNDIRPKTITTIYARGTPTLDLDNGSDTITFTNGVSILGSPTITWPRSLRAMDWA